MPICCCWLTDWLIICLLDLALESNPSDHARASTIFLSKSQTDGECFQKLSSNELIISFYFLVSSCVLTSVLNYTVNSWKVTLVNGHWYSLSIFDEKMFNNKTPAFLFSTGQEEKQSHKPREWMCFGVCFVVVLGYKERLSASVLNVGPFRRSHLVCFRRSTAPALRYSLMIVPSVSPTWKAQSNGQWRFIVIACFF